MHRMLDFDWQKRDGAGTDSLRQLDNNALNRSVLIARVG